MCKIALETIQDGSQHEYVDSTPRVQIKMNENSTRYRTAVAPGQGELWRVETSAFMWRFNVGLLQTGRRWKPSLFPKEWPGESAGFRSNRGKYPGFWIFSLAPIEDKTRSAFVDFYDPDLVDSLLRPSTTISIVITYHSIVGYTVMLYALIWIPLFVWFELCWFRETSSSG